MDDVPMDNTEASGSNRKNHDFFGAAASDREALEMLRLSLVADHFPSVHAAEAARKVVDEIVTDLLSSLPLDPPLNPPLSLPQPSQLSSLRALRKAPALSPEAPARPPAPDPLPTSPEMPPRPERIKPPPVVAEQPKPSCPPRLEYDFGLLWKHNAPAWRKPKVERLPMHVYSAAGPMWGPSELGAKALEMAWSKEGVTRPRLLPDQRRRAFKPAEKADKEPIGMDPDDLSKLEEEFERSVAEEYEAEVKLETAIAEMMNAGQSQLFSPTSRSQTSSIRRNKPTAKAGDRYRMIELGSASCSTPQRLFAEHSPPESAE